MNRRQLLKRSLLSLGALALLPLKGLSQVIEGVKALPGKLGYQEISRFPQKRCENCRSFDAASSECVLLAMRKAMKAEKVWVDKEAYCSMWARS